jgi:hypothetical protein
MNKQNRKAIMTKQYFNKTALNEKYPASESCTCDICIGYCRRPGWWTVDEAEKAINAGYAARMMLEVSPKKQFAVLSPALKCCEQSLVKKELAKKECTFLKDGRCELFDKGLMPLECRFCHHERQGTGLACHIDIGNSWNSNKGRTLVLKWIRNTDFIKKLKCQVK